MSLDCIDTGDTVIALKIIRNYCKLTLIQLLNWTQTVRSTDSTQ
jgi:hypothetical protein